MTTYMQKAVKGMAAINADLGEGWVKDFDLDSLDMLSPWLCTLGQAYNVPSVRLTFTTGFSRGMDALFGTEHWRKRHQSALSHGFDSDTPRGYVLLKAAWTKLISEAR